MIFDKDGVCISCKSHADDTTGCDYCFIYKLNWVSFVRGE